MKYTILIIVNFLMIQTMTLYAQDMRGSLKGRVLDSLGHSPLELANIFLCKKDDSNFQIKLITDKNGVFIIKNLPTSQVLTLSITFTGYNEFHREFSLNDDQLFDLGNIQMKAKTKELDTVIIQAQAAPVVIRKDTIEYNAASFKTRPNAVIEDLLKRLPGLEVDMNGNITFNGKPVSKVLVDGKEFFRDNFLMTTRNLPADMVNKIQVTDTKTLEQAFNDLPVNGMNKTINIKLKKTKNDVFGYVHAGAGTDSRYEASGMANYFNDRKKLTLLASGNNINNVGFISGSDLGVVNPGNGIIESKLLGVNYNDAWGNKLDLNGSYYHSLTNATNESTVARKQVILGDSSFSSGTKNTQQNRNSGNRLSFTVNYVPDSMSTLNFSPDVSIGKFSGNSMNRIVSENSNGQKLNESDGSAVNTGASNDYALQFFFGRKLNSMGRFVSIGFNAQHRGQKSNSLDRSKNIFYKNNLIDSISNLDQQVNTNNEENNYNLFVSYSEPLNKKIRLIVAEGINIINTNTDKKTLKLDSAGRILGLDADFSGAFNSHNLSNSTNLAMEYVGRKWEIGAGVTGFYSQLNNYSSADKKELIQKQFNYTPVANIAYHIGQSNIMRLYFSANTQQPAPEQLQPVPDNSNPLAIKIGNPNLKPSFSQNYGINYSMFGATKSLDFGFQYAPVNSKIINAVFYDDYGRQVSQFVNVNGSYTMGGNISARKNWSTKKSSEYLLLSMNANYSHDVSPINNQLVISENKILSVQASSGFTLADIVSANCSYNFSQNRILYNTAGNQEMDYTIQTLTAELAINLSSFRLVTSMYYTTNSNVPVGFDHSSTLLNLGLTKSFLKSQKLQVKLVVYDLLKQNTNFRRTVTSNYIEDAQSDILQRYALLSLTYHLRNNKNRR